MRITDLGDGRRFKTSGAPSVKGKSNSVCTYTLLCSRLLAFLESGTILAKGQQRATVYHSSTPWP